MKKALKWVLIMAGLGLTACSSLAQKPDSPSERLQGEWVLHQVVQGSMQFDLGQEDPVFSLMLGDDDRVGGQVACNRWNGDVTLSKKRIRVSRSLSTRAFCHFDDPRHSALANRFPGALETAARYELSEDQLRLRTSKSEQWVFHRAP